MVLRPVGSNRRLLRRAVRHRRRAGRPVRLDRVLSLDPGNRGRPGAGGDHPARPVDWPCTRGAGRCRTWGTSTADPRGRAVHRDDGTGEAFGNLSSQMVGGRLVTVDDAVRELATRTTTLAPTCCGPRASRWGRWECCPRSRCSRDVVPAAQARQPRRLADVLAGLDELVAGHDDVEFYVVPVSRRALVLTSQRYRRAGRPAAGLAHLAHRRPAANRALDLLQRSGPAGARAASRAWDGSTGALVERQHPDRPQPPGVRDRAPGQVHRVEVGAAAGRRTGGRRGRDPAGRASAAAGLVPHRGALRRGRRRAALDGDGRPTAYVAVHQYAGSDWQPYSRAVEEVMLDLDGRRHWGKRHEAPAALLAPGATRSGRGCHRGWEQARPRRRLRQRRPGAHPRCAGRPGGTPDDWRPAPALRASRRRAGRWSRWPSSNSTRCGRTPTCCAGRPARLPVRVASKSSALRGRPAPVLADEGTGPGFRGVLSYAAEALHLADDGTTDRWWPTRAWTGRTCARSPAGSPTSGRAGSSC